MQGGRFGHAVEKNFVSVTVLESEIELSLDGFTQSAGAAERGKQIAPGLDAQGAENVVAMAVAFVYGGCGGAGRFGNGTHGQSFFSSARPQA